jgi:hypothetical protein
MAANGSLLRRWNEPGRPLGAEGEERAIKERGLGERDEAVFP